MLDGLLLLLSGCCQWGGPVSRYPYSVIRSLIPGNCLGSKVDGNGWPRRPCLIRARHPPIPAVSLVTKARLAWLALLSTASPCPHSPPGATLGHLGGALAH